MQDTYNDVLRAVTRDYLSQCDPNNPPRSDILEADVLRETRKQFELQNSVITNPSARFRMPKKLAPQQIADIVSYFYRVRRIPPAESSDDTEYDMLGIYCESGEDVGIYVTSDNVFRNLARQYHYTLTNNEFREYMTALRDLAPRVRRCREPCLVPVNNGIFDYDRKVLYSFSPDYVFLSKCRVNYNPNAVNVIIHNDEDNTDWNVEEWMYQLSDDAGITNLLWQILGAIIRPYVNWNKAAWFYSQTGNNGKGTLCELMRELVGAGSYASVSLSDMNKDFALESLIRSTAVIVDENDVGTYIDKAANLKALITHDVVQINRKFKQMIPFRFYGFMVQCLNEMPRVKDRSDSFYRRQIFIPFKKSFTGMERKYIKNDYLHRKEVLEYVLFKVLNMDYYEFDVPDSCLEALEEYKTYNDPVRQFVEEIVPELKWDGLPYVFLYDLFCAWYKVTVKESGLMSQRSFVLALKNVIRTMDTPFMLCEDDKGKDKKWWAKGKMAGPEPMIRTYGLKTWSNPVYKDRGPDELFCTPLNLAANYRGLVRIPTPDADSQKESEDLQQ